MKNDLSGTAVLCYYYIIQDYYTCNVVAAVAAVAVAVVDTC